MQIRSAEFTRGIIGSNDFLKDERPQIAFVGRSNVGKSSVINALVQRKGLVRTSSTPGKTLELNFFLINNDIYFVDLPGYGYAKHSQKRREKMRRMILWYLTSGEAVPRAIVHIIDAKAGLRDFDHDMLRIAQEEGHYTILVMNKIDKLNQKEIAASKKKIAGDPILAEMEHALVFHSAKTGRGRTELLQAIDDALVDNQ